MGLSVLASGYCGGTEVVECWASLLYLVGVGLFDFEGLQSGGFSSGFSRFRVVRLQNVLKEGLSMLFFTKP